MKLFGLEIGTLPEWLTLIVIAGTAWFAFHEYSDGKQQVKVLRALEYSDRVHEEAIASSLYRLHSSMNDIYPEILIALNATASENVSRVYNNYVLTTVRNESLEEDFLKIVSLFEHITNCIENDLCDCKISMSYFSESIKGFWATFGPYVQYTRDTISNQDFGINVEKYAMLILREGQAC